MKVPVARESREPPRTPRTPPVPDSLLDGDGDFLGAAAAGLDVVAPPEELATWAEQ